MDSCSFVIWLQYFRSTFSFSCTLKLFSYVSFTNLKVLIFIEVINPVGHSASCTRTLVHMNKAEIHFNSFEWRQSIILEHCLLGCFFVYLLLHLACLVPGVACQVFVIRVPTPLYFVLLPGSFDCLQLSNKTLFLGDGFHFWGLSSHPHSSSLFFLFFFLLIANRLSYLFILPYTL